MSHDLTRSPRKSLWPVLLLAAACGPPPSYTRFDSPGDNRIDGGVEAQGSGGAASIDAGGVSSGGVGAGGLAPAVGSGGVSAAGGAPGSGGDADIGGLGSAGGGGVPVGSGGSPAASGGAGAVTGGTGGMPVGSGGAAVATGGVVGSGGVRAGSGGSAVATGGTAAGGHAGAGAVAGGGGLGGGGTSGATDPSHYGFESSVQGWAMAAGGGTWTSIGRSTTTSFAGTSSLAAAVSAQSGVTYILEVSPPTPAIPAGATVTFHVRVPTAAALTAIQAYVMETGTYRFTGTQIAGSNLARNSWVKVTVAVPSDAAAILRLGVQFESSGTWNDTVYLDAIDW